jgi:hypothetical protein
MMCFLFECDEVVKVRKCVASRKENSRLLRSAGLPPRWEHCGGELLTMILIEILIRFD